MAVPHPSTWDRFDAPGDVERLASRVGWLNAVGWSSLAIAALGSPALCAGGLLFGPEYILTPVGMFTTLGGVVLPILAVGVSFLVRIYRRRLEVRLRLGRIAEAREWAFRQTPTAPQVTYLRRFQLYPDDGEVVGAIAWRRDGGAIAADLDFPTGMATAFVLPDAVPAVPGLILRPRDAFDQLVGEGKGVELPGQDEFNRAYGLLTGLDTVRAAVGCVGPEVVAFCLAHGDVVVEARGGHLLVFWERGTASDEEFSARLQWAEEVAEMLPE